MISIVLAQAAAVQAQDLSQKVDSLFAAWDTPNSPGCALGVIRDGEFIYKRGYGMASLEHKVPISPTTVFLIGSASKMFTAAAVLLAEGQGHLSLDDDIRTYLPEIPDYSDTITIRQLLGHTSGIRGYYNVLGLAGTPVENVFTNEQFLALLARQKGLNFKPGTDYGYTASSYVLLGLIVERATGSSLSLFAEENVFRPLGMEHTHFHDDRFHVVESRANAYTSRGDGEFAFAWWSNYATVGSSGVYTTVEDLYLWDQNYYANKLGLPDLVDRLLTPGTLSDGTELGYAAGHHVGEYRGLPFFGHGGSTMGFRAFYVQFPEQRFSVICLCNLLSIDPRHQVGQLAELYLADEFKDEEVQEPIEVSEARLHEMAGAYRSPAFGDILEFFAEEGSLAFHKEDGGTTVLEPLGATRFRLPSGFPYRAEYEFYRADTSKRWRLKATMRGYPPYTEETFHYEPVELVDPAAVRLPDYVGAYHSDELPATYPVTLENGELVVALPSRGSMILRPTIRDHFQIGSYPVYLEFVRDEGGRISGFDLRSARLRNVRFVRQPDEHTK
jgi:CubicO group peptidase (beta-lactamase class C family)